MKREILPIRSRGEFRSWLEKNHASAPECFVICRRGNPARCEGLAYLDAVEEALCFGWIDSTLTRMDGQSVQRFAPRRANSHWTELNKERVRRLERLGRMTEAGRAVLPPMDDFLIDAETEADLRAAGAWEAFLLLPVLYQRVRVSNLQFTRRNLPQDYARMLVHTAETALAGKTFGEWTDYGRLTEKLREEE